MATSAGSAGSSSVKADPNVTPMIDVMLVLLIIFMIVTPLIAAGFKATMPKGKNLDPRPEGDNEVVLGIDAVGKYFLERRGRSRRRRWRTSCSGIYAARTEDKILYFKADNQLKYAQDPGSGGDRAPRPASGSWRPSPSRRPGRACSRATRTRRRTK